MRLGMFMMPVHPPARSFTETLAEDEEKALYADQLGFDELWLGEHFSASSEPIPSPLMFMASLLPRTKNLTFGTGVICLPNHDPVTVAAEVAQFDHMSRGRFMLGIGPGGLLSDFELFGNADRGVRARKTMESIALIQRIWAQDPPYDFPGEFRSVTLKEAIIPGLGIGTCRSRSRNPARRSRCRSVAAIRRPRASPGSRAGAFCPAIICRPTPSPRIGRATAKPARTPGEPRRARTGGWRAISWWRRATPRLATVSSARKDRTITFTPICARCCRASASCRSMKPDPNMPDEEATVDVITEGCMLYGSPKTMLDKLVAFRDEVGPFGTLLMTGLDWSGPNEAWERDSMRLLAQEVMPKFRQHATAQAAE